MSVSGGLCTLFLLGLTLTDGGTFKLFHCPRFQDGDNAGSFFCGVSIRINWVKIRTVPSELLPDVLMLPKGCKWPQICDFLVLFLIKSGEFRCGSFVALSLSLTQSSRSSQQGSVSVPLRKIACEPKRQRQKVERSAASQERVFGVMEVEDYLQY